MDEPQRHVRDAKCFELTIGNFNRRINRGAVERTFGTVGGYHWYTNMKKISREGIDYLSIHVKGWARTVYHDFSPKELCTEMAICVKNDRLDRWEKCQGKFKLNRYEWRGWEKFMRMDTILDPDSGFLSDDGALVMQIETRVDYSIRWDGNKIINLLDPFEGSVLFETDSKNFYARKQMIMFHSPVLAEQLADGRDEVVLSEDCDSVEIFLQRIHGVKLEVPKHKILDLLYFAHKYQVLTLLRQLEIQIKRYPAKEIHDISTSLRDCCFKTFLGKEYHEDLMRIIDACEKPFSKKYKKLNIRKRKMLLAITRAPFSLDLDSDSSHNNNNSNTHNPFSIFRFFSETVKSITGC